jgi:DNA polymerase-1
VFAYLQGLERQAIARGYVETILGRRRHFEFSRDGLGKLRGQDPDSLDLSQLKPDRFEAQALRQAANAPIQGSSADLIKRAMVLVEQALAPHAAQLLLTVHDELVVELPPEEWETVAPLIRQAMEAAVPLTVPLVAEVRHGSNWMEAK